MATVWIVGCGYVGGELATRRVARGDTVIGVRRNIDALPHGVVGMPWDVTTDAPPCPRADLVVYAVSPGGYREEAYRAAYVEGVRRLTEALDRDDVRPGVAIFVSTTGVYGQTDGEWVDENSTTEPLGFSGEVVLEAERAFLAADLAERVAVLRLGGIYGPGRTRFVRKVRDGEATIPAERRFTNRIHRDDCAGAIDHLAGVLAAADDADNDGIYVGVDNEPAPYGEVVAWLAEQFDVPVPEPSADGEDVRQRRRPRTNKRCRNARLRGVGYTFAYPSYREGYGSLLDQLD